MSSLLSENNNIPNVVDSSTFGSGEPPPIDVQSEKVDENNDYSNNNKIVEIVNIEGMQK